LDYDLLAEAVCLLAQTAIIRTRWKEVRDDAGSVSAEIEELDLSEEKTDLKDAKKLLRELASRLRVISLPMRLMRFGPF
jgi:hypothetical protein